MTTTPDYYTRLDPFLERFRTGAPVLMYHHVGPRKRGARLKGLYVSPELFARQLAELKSAGFSTREFAGIQAAARTATAQDSLGERPNPDPVDHRSQISRGPLAVPSPLPSDGRGEGQGEVRAAISPGERHLKNPTQHVFLTIDDGFSSVFEHALPILRENGFRAILYLVSDLIGKTNEWQQKVGDVVEPLMDAAQVRTWLEAGHEIGAHTQTHPRLTKLSIAAAREEITASKKSLEDRFSLRIDHFCYPYGDWNEPVRDLVIAAGYRTACTTHAGVNTPETSPFELKRYMARYRSRSLRGLWRSIRAAVR